jgi:hypothetical protein
MTFARAALMLMIAAVGSAISAGVAGTDESVLTELVRLERETGLAITFYENDLGVISFKKRAYYDMGRLVPMGSSGGTVSPDGAEVAVDSSIGGLDIGTTQCFWTSSTLTEAAFANIERFLAALHAGLLMSPSWR